MIIIVTKICQFTLACTHPFYHTLHKTVFYLFVYFITLKWIESYHYIIPMYDTQLKTKIEYIQKEWSTLCGAASNTILMDLFSALLGFCVGNSPVTGEFPSQRPVTRSFDVFFDLRLNKQLSKYSCVWWFETPPRSLLRHCSDNQYYENKINML